MKSLEDDIKNINDLSEFIPSKLGFNKEEREAILVIFWLVYLIEHIFRGELNKWRPIGYNEVKFQKMTFGGKIKMFKRGYRSERGHDPMTFVDIASKLSKVRNDAIHQNKHIKQIFYKGRSIIERTTQEQIILDFYNACMKVV